jgi:hypothetical protein
VKRGKFRHRLSHSCKITGLAGYLASSVNFFLGDCKLGG